MDDLTARTKSGWSASRAKYKYQLCLERLNNLPLPSYQSPAMLEGIKREPDARLAYCLRHGCEVTEVGFVPHPKIPMAGASPDGLIGTDGVLEIKCPEHTAHWLTLKTERVDEGYIKQIQFQLACTGRAWAHYVSWHPEFPTGMQFWWTQIYRVESMIADLEQQTIAFLAEVEEEVEWARQRYGVEKAAA